MVQLMRISSTSSKGVSIGIFVKAGAKNGPARVHHADLWGDRKGKFDWLAKHDLFTTEWKRLSPVSPYYLFTPIDLRLQEEYSQGWKVTEIFQINSIGITTSRDAFAYDLDRGELEERIADFLNPLHSDDAVRTRYFGTQGRGMYPPGDNRDWAMAMKRSLLLNDTEWREKIVPCSYRPFDVRSLFYHRSAIDFGRWDVMRHMLERENLGLNTCRQINSLDWNHVTCTNWISDDCYVSLYSRERAYTFPLYLYQRREGEPNSQSEMRNLSPWPEGQFGRRPNLDAAFVKKLERRLGWTFVPDGQGNLGQVNRNKQASGATEEVTFGPDDIFHYMYAILHAPSYRELYAEFLKIDFPAFR